MRDWPKIDAAELAAALLRYADDIESEGRTYAPACMRAAAARLSAAMTELQELKAALAAAEPCPDCVRTYPEQCGGAYCVQECVDAGARADRG